jgi:hypothetical protein
MIEMETELRFVSLACLLVLIIAVAIMAAPG